MIIVGSVDENGTLSDFSNRPGTLASSVIMAQGQGICCVYDGSQIRTTTNAQGTFVTIVNGTSFAAPQVSGAVALLAQAFPNLTGAQIVSLLLRTARDAGAAGTDSLYGRGILDIANAFSPQGATSLAGTATQVSLSSLAGATSTPMGDAITGSSVGAVMLDGYQRAYRLDLAAGLRNAGLRPVLHDSLGTGLRPLAIDAGSVALAFTVDRRFGAVSLRLAPGEGQQARVLASS
ncbi:MAG: S8 family serine peptidase, partial [Novosphingobium sp.]